MKKKKEKTKEQEKINVSTEVLKNLAIFGGFYALAGGFSK